MQHAERWTPSKYVMRGGRLRSSRDASQVGIGSRLIADAVAGRYAQQLPRFAAGRLVDLGCGTVPLYGAYRSLVDSVTCVDWPNSPHAAQHLDVTADLGQRLPFADASFETVILSDVLEHVPDPWLLWREMARLLGPGGHAFVNVPFLYGIHEGPHDYFRYTEFALRRFAGQSGFELVHFEALGGSLHVLADLLAKHLAHVPLLGRPLALLTQMLVGALDHTRLGRRIAERSGTRFPLGYFLVARRMAA